MKDKLITPLLAYPTMSGAAAAFDPTSISGLAHWLDFSDADTLFTDAGSTKVSADGNAIYQANDKSGNNSHSTQTTSDWNLYAGRVKSGDSAQSVNGSSIGTSNETFDAPYTGYVPAIGRCIGAGVSFGHPLNGDIGEILLYQPSISDADALKVNTYLNNKWNIY